MLFLVGCPGEEPDDDDDTVADDDDTAPDDDDSAGDDDDSAVSEVISVDLTSDVTEADTKGQIVFSVVVNYGDGTQVTDSDFEFQVTSAATPVWDGMSLSSVTSGVVDVTAVGGGQVSSSTLSVTFVAAPVAAGDLLLNELLADGTAGDANGDGSIDANEDAFVELVNLSGRDLSLAGAGLFESELTTLARHTFGELDLPSPGAVVVFGGGEPNLTADGVTFLAADNAQDPGTPFFLHLDPAGDMLELRNASDETVCSLAWGSEAGSVVDANIDMSVNLSPDGTGTTYDDHETVAGSMGALYSPGTLADGSAWANWTGELPD